MGQTTIEGVLTQDSGCGGAGAEWVLSLDLAPWRAADGAWEERPLRVVIPMAKAAALRGFGRWREGESVRVTVDKITRVKGRLFLFAFLADGKPPVRRVAAPAPPTRKRAVAPSRVDSAAGRLRLDRGAGWYGAWRGPRKARYEIAIQVDDPDDRVAAARAIADGGPLAQRAEEGVDALRVAAARRLASVYDRRWRQGGAVLSQAQIADRLSLASIVVHPSGQTTVLLRTDGLFGDHVVEIRIARSGRLTQIALAG